MLQKTSILLSVATFALLATGCSQTTTAAADSVNTTATQVASKGISAASDAASSAASSAASGAISSVASGASSSISSGISSSVSNVMSTASSLSSSSSSASSATYASASSASSQGPTCGVDGSFTLPNAKSGMCYGKVVIPAKYKTVTEKILATPQSEKLTIIPAEYKVVKEKVLDMPESTKIVTIPATYKTETKTITVSPAYTEWKTGLHPEARVVPASLLASARASGVDLENAKAGTCFYEFYAPPQYKTTTEKVLDTAGSKRIISEPPVFKTGTKKILVTPERTKLVTVPAVYKTVTEKVQVAPAKKVWKETKCEDTDCSVEEMMCLVEIPPQYKTVTKQVLVKPETTKTVKIPAVYKTVPVNELVKPASTKEVNVPPTYKTVQKTVKVSDAKYVWSDSLMEKPGMERTSSVICKVEVPAVTKTITKKVIATPATTKTVKIPARYKEVEVTKVVTPERTKKTIVPATYKTITKQVKVSDQTVKWMPVLCKSSMTVETISKIQKALTDAGFPTPITGVLDEATKQSVEAYQKKRGLIVSGLSMNTLKDLGVF